MTSKRKDVLESARDYEEIQFFLRLRGCSRCGAHAYERLGFESSLAPWDLDEGGTAQRCTLWYDVRCPHCQELQSYRFWEGPEFGQRPLWEMELELSGPSPSRMISPHEFMSELCRFDQELTPDVLERRRTQKFDTTFVPNVIRCCNELLKFFVADEPVMPLDVFRTPEARAARETHPERYTRACIIDYHARYTELWKQINEIADAMAAEREAAGIVEPRVQLVTPGFSDAALKFHAFWLEDKPGQRLEVRDVDARGRKLSTRDLTAAILERCNLEGADLSFARLHAAKLTEVRLRGSDLSSAMVAGTTLVRCDFSEATMAIAKLGDAEITDCDFSNANLDRSSWYRSKVTRCTFANARLTDAPLDKAVFTDCNFRGADLGHGRFDTCTSMDVVFVRCDLRDTNWFDRDLFRARFIDCKLDGIHGRPNTTEATFENPDLSPAGDGSQIATSREVLQLWGIDPDHPRANLSWHACHMLTLAEYELAKPHLLEFGFRVEHEGFHDGKVWLDGRELIDDPAGPKLDRLLADDREAMKPLPTEQELKDAALAQTVIDDAIDAGLSYEATVFELMKRGFTRDEALTAIARPNAAL